MSDSFARQIRRTKERERRRTQRQQHRELYGDGPMHTVYHGTAGLLADSVQAGGIRLGSDGRAYVTDSPEVAYAYAVWSTGMTVGMPSPCGAPTTDVGRKVAASGRHVAVVFGVRLPADTRLEPEAAFPPPLPWADEIVDGDCFYLHEPVPAIAVGSWELFRVAELSDARNLAALKRDGDLIAEAFARSRGGKAGGPFRDAIPDPSRLVDAVCEASPNVSSPHHGAGHWLQVATMAQRLLRADERPGADAPILFAFAALHDSMRHSEGLDPEHGARAAAFARKLVEDGLLRLDDARLDVLCDALTRHDHGAVSADETIGACWDADRLCLPRLGITPRAELLSTAAGRALAPDAARLVFLPTDWRFVIFRFSLEAAASIVDDGVTAVSA